MKFLIYGLVDPRTKLVRYVGRSSNGKRRPRTHSCPAALAVDNTYKGNWIRSLRKDGLRPEIVVLQESSKETLGSDEEWWIAYGKACGWPLTNLTTGGDQPILNEESRARMSAARRGRPGHPYSDEAKAVMSASAKQRLSSPEFRAKLSAAQRKGWTAEARTHRGEENKRRGQAPETRAKIAASMRAARARTFWSTRKSPPSNT